MNATSPLPAPLSIASWAELPEETPGELVHGALVEEEVPDFLHEAIVAWLVGTLRGWAIPKGGIVGGSDAKLALAPGLGRKPDVSVFLPPNLPPRRGVVTIAPYLMVEVISPAARDVRRDRAEKPAEYEAFGSATSGSSIPKPRPSKLSFSVTRVGTSEASRRAADAWSPRASKASRSSWTSCGPRSRAWATNQR